ncbi:CPCC family cysteine-rich protein [Streptomyces fulvoviolaceus]|uniref:CPCC family cysteine-rich protein n=1 Tax=Streptomyces fulvoviolaceus TaxID=285535 RepID=UPI0021C1200C|nr:CPCC family cysteine-rich protein [Streptomyces fulvoviolaceus]MCT9080376.1 CPCC family cysteine-rich protein [Streptomyces fulvoviolaceus]
MTGTEEIVEWLPCPCCGHRTLGELWAYEICPVCYWEEDSTQLRYPWCGFGPNHGLNLFEAQANFRRIGAVTEGMKRYVRPPKADEPLDPGFRPADPALDPFEERFTDTPYPDDLTGLYYWRPAYWRRTARSSPSGV